MAITNQTISGMQKDSNVASSTISFTPAGTGRLLVCEGSIVGGGSADVSSVVDSNTTTWTLVKSSRSAGNVVAFTAYLANNGAGITSVTANFAGGATNFSIISISEWNAVATASPQDQTTSAVGANPLATGNITNTDANDLVIAVCGSDDSANSAWGSNAGYTTLHEEGDSTTFHVSKAVYRIAAASTGPFGTTFDYPPASADNAALIISFKPAGAGGVDIQPRRVYVLQ